MMNHNIFLLSTPDSDLLQSLQSQSNAIGASAFNNQAEFHLPLPTVQKKLKLICENRKLAVEKIKEIVTKNYSEMTIPKIEKLLARDLQGNANTKVSARAEISEEADRINKLTPEQKNERIQRLKIEHSEKQIKAINRSIKKIVADSIENFTEQRNFSITQGKGSVSYNIS